MFLAFPFINIFYLFLYIASYQLLMLGSMCTCVKALSCSKVMNIVFTMTDFTIQKVLAAWFIAHLSSIIYIKKKY